MNIIKYLKYKNNCPECNHKLYKNTNNEIYCIHCGLLVLDNYPVTPSNINHALQLAEKQKTQNTPSDLKYIGTINGKRRYI